MSVYRTIGPLVVPHLTQIYEVRLIMIVQCRNNLTLGGIMASVGDTIPLRHYNKSEH